MSETHELDKAHYEFRKFLQDLHAFPATCTGLYQRDSDVNEFVTIDRADATNCFLRKYPSYEPFRDRLAEVRPGEEKFDFNRELWDTACKE